MNFKHLDFSKNFWDSLVNRRDLSILASNLHELITFQGGFGQEYQGMDGLRLYSMEMLSVFPDFRVEVREMMHGSNLVMGCLRFRGTQQGMFLDNFRMNLETTFDAMVHMRFAEHLLVEVRLFPDLVALQKQQQEVVEKK